MNKVKGMVVYFMYFSLTLFELYSMIKKIQILKYRPPSGFEKSGATEQIKRIRNSVFA